MDPQEIDYEKERILVVDDDPVAREPIAEMLRHMGFATESANGAEEALAALAAGSFTCLITDVRMPVFDGLCLIRRVKRDNPHICSIAMTAYTDQYTYMDVIRAGASDFINKPFPMEELEAKVKRAITERSIKESLSRQSVTDSLTGLFNHRYFYDRLAKEVARAERQGQPLSLVMLDIDDFKVVNDRHGHRVGDEVLHQVGHVILASIRSEVDTAFRYGGDEFAIILIDSDLEVARAICDRILLSLQSRLNLRASVGLAAHERGLTPEMFVDRVDQGLYQAKLARKRQAAPQGILVR